MFVLLQIVAPWAEPEKPPFFACPMLQLTEGVPGEFVATYDDPKRKPRTGDYRLEATVYARPEGDDGVALTVDIELTRHGMETLLLYDDPALQSGASTKLREGDLTVGVHAWRGTPDAAGLTKVQAECRAEIKSGP